MLTTAAFDAEYGSGPAFDFNPATTMSYRMFGTVASLLDAVRTSEPPGVVLPCSGETFAKAGAACLMARKTLQSAD